MGRIEKKKWLISVWNLSSKMKSISILWYKYSIITTIRMSELIYIYIKLFLLILLLFLDVSTCHIWRLWRCYSIGTMEPILNRVGRPSSTGWTTTHKKNWASPAANTGKCTPTPSAIPYSITWSKIYHLNNSIFQILYVYIIF